MNSPRRRKVAPRWLSFMGVSPGRTLVVHVKLDVIEGPVDVIPPDGLIATHAKDISEESVGGFHEAQIVRRALEASTRHRYMSSDGMAVP